MARTRSESPLGLLPILIGMGTDPLARLYQRERGLPEWVLLFTRSGQAFFRSGRKQLVAGVEDLVLIKPHSPHEYGAYGSDTHWRSIWVHFQPRPHWLPWLQWPEELPGILRLTLDDPELHSRVAARLEAAVTLGTGNQPHRDDLALNAMEEAILWCCRAWEMGALTPRDARIDTVTRYLCEHPEENPNILQMAEMSHLSPSRFAHRFRQLLGMTPVQFLEQQRMRRAVQLLRGTAQPVAEVARAVGYDDPLYFTKRFKRLTGVSPTQFREHTGQPPAIETVDEP